MKRIFLWPVIIGLSLLFSLNSFTPPNNSNLVHEVLTQTNTFRKSKGMNTLEMRGDLNALANKHSEDMAKGKVGFGHSGFGKRYAKAKKEIRNIHGFAENVAYGSISGKQVVIMWEKSPGHRRNLLGPYKYAGIGVAKNKQGQLFYTEVFAD
jgi:uncharacterized protein YkwD